MYLICVYFLETKSQLSLYHNNTILQVAMTEFVTTAHNSATSYELKLCQINLLYDIPWMMYFNDSTNFMTRRNSSASYH